MGGQEGGYVHSKRRGRATTGNRRILNAFLRNLGLKSLSSLLNPAW